jgi:two-component system heavy metal sensor histidine kinase CusS
MIRSLRSRLLLSMITGMALLLILFSVMIYFVIRNALEEQFNQTLASSARLLAAGVELEISESDTEQSGPQDENSGVDIEFDVQMMPEFQREKHPSYFQIWRQDGTVVSRSPSLGQSDLLRFEGTPGQPVFQSVRMPNERPGRAVGLKFMPRIEEDPKKIPSSASDYMLTLVVARDATEMLSNLRFLRWLLLIASAGIIGLSCLISAIIVRQGLGPLHSLSAAISTINEDDLSGRIEMGKLPTEIMPIQERLNDLLARLEASFNRERRFTADVAHELRTPLAGLRTTLEVALRREREPQQYQTSLGDCLGICKAMESTVTNLLALARLEAQQVRFQKESIDVSKLVNLLWSSYVSRTEKRNVTFENQLSNDVTCVSDPEFLTLVFTNLLDNAVEYVNENGRIWITGKPTNDFIDIRLANTGCQLGEEEVSRVFDRFWRSDSARTKKDSRCGIGLALVQSIALALGGEAKAEVVDKNVFTIRLRLPRALLNLPGN